MHCRRSRARLCSDGRTRQHLRRRSRGGSRDSVGGRISTREARTAASGGHQARSEPCRASTAHQAWRERVASRHRRPAACGRWSLRLRDRGAVLCSHEAFLDPQESAGRRGQTAVWRDIRIARRAATHQSRCRLLTIRTGAGIVADRRSDEQIPRIAPAVPRIDQRKGRTTT